MGQKVVALDGRRVVCPGGVKYHLLPRKAEDRNNFSG